MKILHTSDWHLGAKIEGKDRLDEQEKVLNEIVKIADDFDVSAIIIAGDIFHNKMPQAAAEDLFFRTVEKLSDNGNRLVFVLSGNHDDPERLGAGKPLAERFNILLATDLNSIDISRTKVDSRSRVIDAGEGFVKFKRGDEFATIAFLPFLSNNLAKELGGQETFQSSFEALSKNVCKHFSSDSFNVFVSHAFLSGAKLADGSKVSVGDSLALSLKNLPDNAHYIALGHLHSAQKIGSNAYYSGAITELRVRDAEPQVLIVDGDNNGLKEVNKVALKNAIKISEISVPNIAFAYKKINENAPEDYVYLTICQESPIRQNDVNALRAQFPKIVNIKFISTQAKTNPQVIENFKAISDRELFSEFYKHVTGREPSSELVELFLECRGDQNAAD